jgi:hypothetical protein
MRRREKEKSEDARSEKQQRKKENKREERGEGVGEGRGPDERGLREVAALPGTLINLDPIFGPFSPCSYYTLVRTAQSTRVIPVRARTDVHANTAASKLPCVRVFSSLFHRSQDFSAD